MQVRLVDGNYSSEGRVEIFCNGEWGTICSNEFGFVEGDTICRQLGYSDISAILNPFPL